MLLPRALHVNWLVIPNCSTMMRFGAAPVILLVNNRGYAIEILIHDGPYNKIQNWDYTGTEATHVLQQYCRCCCFCSAPVAKEEAEAVEHACALDCWVRHFVLLVVLHCF
jgi:TPP-dependent 2-oxoacid decarboxylase